MLKEFLNCSPTFKENENSEVLWQATERSKSPSQICYESQISNMSKETLKKTLKEDYSNVLIDYT